MDVLANISLPATVAEKYTYIPNYNFRKDPMEGVYEYIRMASITAWSLLIVYHIVGAVMYAALSKIPVVSCGPSQRALFVTAHPDDECMFFGPAILRLLKNHTVYVLCLTTGNYFNLGRLRKTELWRSCEVLGIPLSNVTLMDIMDLRDDPKIWWSYRRTSQIILDQVERLNITKVYSFDHVGVSGHINHRSIFYALGSLVVNNQMPSYCKAYMLESVNLVRKYSAIFDAAISGFNSHHFMVNLAEAKKLRDAMKKHCTQLTWYRRIYIFFSRYMYMNTFKELDKDDFQLVLQMYDGPVL